MHYNAAIRIYSFFYGSHSRVRGIGLYRHTFPGTHYVEDAEMLLILNSCDLTVGITSEVSLSSWNGDTNQLYLIFTPQANPSAARKPNAVNHTDSCCTAVCCRKDI